jgi:hypothetical protein
VLLLVDAGLVVVVFVDAPPAPVAALPPLVCAPLPHAITSRPRDIERQTGRATDMTGVSSLAGSPRL